VSTEPRQTSAAELKAQIEAERDGRPFLVLRDGEGEQRIVTIEDGTTELWVGRGEAAGLRIDWDEEVSALHAQIRTAGEGRQWDPDGDVRQVRIAGSDGRDVCVADESLPGGDPGGRSCNPSPALRAQKGDGQSGWNFGQGGFVDHR